MHIYQLNFFGKGHIYPTIPIVRELLTRGVEVTSYGLPDHEDMISESGVQFRPYHSHPQQETNAMQLAAYQTWWAVELLPNLLAEIEEDQPQIIITDSMLPLGWYAARISNLPLVVSTTHFVANKTIINALGLTEEQQIHSGDTGTFEDDLANFRQAAHTIQSQFDIKPLRAQDTFQIPGDLTLVTTSAELQPFSNLLDKTYKFIGPIIEARGKLPHYLSDQVGKRTSIYVSLGTMAHDPNVYEIFPLAFDGAPFQVLISAGGKQIALENLPENILLYEYVPQLALLQNVDLFVTHGGWNSVNEALFHNLPMVICPQGKDQFLNAEIIEKLGAGKVLLELTPDGLRAAVDELLTDETYRKRAAEIGSSLRAAGGKSRAADEILNWMQQQLNFEG